MKRMSGIDIDMIAVVGSQIASAESLNRLDSYLAAYDVVLTEHLVVDAPPEVVFAAARGFDFLTTDAKVVTGLMTLRSLPSRLRGRPAVAPSTPDARPTDASALPGWVNLGETPGRELVFGAVGTFWKADIEWHDVPAEEFAAFAEPGWGKSPATSWSDLMVRGARSSAMSAGPRRRPHLTGPDVPLLVADPSIRRLHPAGRPTHDQTERRGSCLTPPSARSGRFVSVGTTPSPHRRPGPLRIATWVGGPATSSSRCPSLTSPRWGPGSSRTAVSPPRSEIPTWPSWSCSSCRWLSASWWSSPPCAHTQARPRRHRALRHSLWGPLRRASPSASTSSC